MNAPTLDEIIGYMQKHIDGQSAAVLSVNEQRTLLAALAAIAREPTKMEILAARLTSAPFCETCRDMREEVAGQLYDMGD